MAFFGNNELDSKKREGLLGMASILSGMSTNPNVALQGMASQGIADIQKTRAATVSSDKLAKEAEQALRLIGIKHPDLTQAIQGGFMSGKEAVMEAMKRNNEPAKARATEKDATGRLRYIDDGANVFEIDSSLTPEIGETQFTQINALRDDLNKDLSQFQVIKQGYNNIQTFFKKPNQVTDYAMAVAFAKVLDPGSVAREGEVNAINSAGAKIPAFKAAFANAIKGTGKMDARMRFDIATAATSLYKERAEEAQKSIDRYGSLAGRAGIPEDSIYLGSEVKQPAVIPPWDIPASLSSSGMTQTQWQALPYSRKSEYMKVI